MPDRADRAAVIALFGPTGVGKTAVAIALARRLRDEGADPVAVSADALQVYRGLELLTGAATAAERALLEHRLLAFLAPDRTFSAGEYAALAHAEIDTALETGRTPIVVGGTGLYLQAALCDLDLRPPPPADLRTRLRDELARSGPAALHERLMRLDPSAAGDVSATDGRRIVRALELLEMGDRPAPAGERSRLWTDRTRHPTALFGLVMERARLDELIDARVDTMVAAGAGEQVRSVAAAGVSETARKALGFDALLAGDVESMKRETRRYARRQLTWMRKLPAVTTVDVTDGDADAAAERIDALRNSYRQRA